jgi:4-hydroxybenzoate polyprenyltransferase
MVNFDSCRPVPLVVDLDGTLIRSDLLIETAFAKLARQPMSIFELLRALISGKAELKHVLADGVAFDASLLPYDDVVLARIRQASESRPVYLVSAADHKLVDAVATHLGLFTGWFGSDATSNLAGDAKARLLISKFGKRGFDYVGNDAADIPVWAVAANAIAIRCGTPVVRRLAKMGIEVEQLSAERPGWRNWLRLLRIHQYAKNTLVFVPMITSHQLSIAAASKSLLAFVAFSVCASSVYVLNDLVDLQADRTHPRKRNRPLASGEIPLIHAMLLAPVLLALGLAFAAFVSYQLLAVLSGYVVLTTAYSFVLKRKMLIDVISLAMLYVIRVLAGAVAINVIVSEWLLGFSMFIFISLALIKRYVELTVRIDAGMPDPTNRNYKLADLEVVVALSAAAAFNAVTVFALYISSSTVRELYRHPSLLWLICPMLIYWTGRALMMAHRRMMDDDPIAFALRDSRSLLTLALILLVVFAAT